MTKYKKNQRVEGYYDDAYYPAVVHDINEDGTYIVHFDDGDILEDMVDDELRLPQEAPETTDTADEKDFDRGNTEKNNCLPKPTEIAEIPAFKPKQQQPKLDVQVMLAKVEDFLLPKAQIKPKNGLTRNGINEGTPPHDRLMHLLHEMSVGEHIRSLQFLYRDGEDDLKLAMEIRNSGVKESPLEQDDDSVAGAGRITSKKLMESITEGRCRAIALTRICYGSDSIESLKSLVDLSNIYAVQGKHKDEGVYVLVLRW